MTGSQTPAQTVKSDPSNFENRNRLWIGTSLVMTGNILSFAAKLIARRGLTPNQLTDPSRFILQIEWAVILSVLVLGVVFFVERLPASSIGIRRLSWTDTMLAVAFYMFGRQVYAFLGPVAGRLGLSYIPIRILDSPPLLEWTSVIAASVSEELVFRGYLIERVAALSRKTSVGVIFSCLLFAVWHFPLWGPQAILSAGGWGIVIAIQYVWRRNLPACVLTHLLTDTLGTGQITFGKPPPNWGRYFGHWIYFRVGRSALSMR